MDNLETKSPIAGGDHDMQAQIDALRHLVMSILILVVVLSGTFNIYLLRQWRSVSKELAQIRPQAAQIINDYQKSGPLMDDFLKKITDYGRTHPDFAPILARYRLSPSAATGAPPAAPVTSPIAKPKK
jgi:hypothetical protein